jgi:hypothetical protein
MSRSRKAQKGWVLNRQQPFTLFGVGYIKSKGRLGWGCTSVLEYFNSEYKVLRSIFNTEKEKKKSSKGELKGRKRIVLLAAERGS